MNEMLKLIDEIANGKLARELYHLRVLISIRQVFCTYPQLIELLWEVDMESSDRDTLYTRLSKVRTIKINDENEKLHRIKQLIDACANDKDFYEYCVYTIKDIKGQDLPNCEAIEDYLLTSDMQFVQLLEEDYISDTYSNLLGELHPELYCGYLWNKDGISLDRITKKYAEVSNMLADTHLLIQRREFETGLISKLLDEC